MVSPPTRPGLLDRLVGHADAPLHSTQHRQKKAAFVNIFVMFLSFIPLGTVFLYYRCFWAGFFFFSSVLSAGAGLAHFLITKRHRVALTIQAWTSTWLSIGCHWAFGPGSSAFMWHWFMSGPAILTSMQLSRTQAAALAAIGVGSLITIQVLYVAYGEAATGRQPIAALPRGFWYLFTTLNMVLPGIMHFGHALHALHALEAYQAHLEATIARAEMLCEGLLRFDLDSLPPKEPTEAGDCRHDTIIRSIYRVVEQMKLYRPFLPQYLVQPEPGPSAPASPLRALPSTVPSDDSTTDLASEDGLPLSSPVRPPNRTQTFRELGRPLHRGPASLVLVAVPGVDRVLAEGGHALADAVRIAHTFCSAVIEGLRGNAGEILTLRSDQAVGAWNVQTACHRHVSRSLAAAVEIRDALKVMHPFCPHAAALGVWSGELFSGSLGTSDQQIYGAFDCEIARARALQRYAAATARPIMASARVWSETCHAPEYRLLPVDVLDLGEAGLQQGEVVYECLHAIEQDEDEWMYQVEGERSHAAHHLHNVFTELRRGVETAEALDRVLKTLAELQGSGDQHVAAVAAPARRVGRLQRPYCRRPQPFWGDPTAAPAPARPASPADGKPHPVPGAPPPRARGAGTPRAKGREISLDTLHNISNEDLFAGGLPARERLQVQAGRVFQH